MIETDEQYGDGPEELPDDEAPTPEHRTRGVGWLLFPPLLCLAVGGLFGAGHQWMTARTQAAVEAGMWNGMLLGVKVGAVVGVIIWTFFPYTGSQDSRTE